jgi:hypothetical protein
MLVLSRKSNESVVVGGSGRFESLLRVTVLEIQSGCVRPSRRSLGTNPRDPWAKRIAGKRRNGMSNREEPL